jgi:protein-L-isoaspartate O-methyltransferase
LYASTPAGALINILSKIRFPEGSEFTDWGAGLGLACFTAALTKSFKNIVGYEIDQRLFNEAEKIRIKFNWNNALKNVRFENKDFLEVDPRPHSVIFIYRPFVDNFPKLMSEKLKNTKPGTFIVSHAYGRIDVFSPKYFRSIYPDHFDFSTPDFLLGIYVFIRK